jgi:hypothetical protein
MPDRIKSFKVICSGGLNSNENHLDLAEKKPGAATRLINYEPSLYGGYRRMEGYEFFDTDYPEVGPGSTEGAVLGVVAFRNEGNGNPYIIAARKDLNVNTYSFWKMTPGVGWQELTDAPTRVYAGTYNTVLKIRHVQFDFGVGGQLAFVDGVNPGLVFDGVNWTEITVADAGDQVLTAPAVVEVFENHLFMSGDPADRAIVAHSAPSDPIVWTAAAGGGQITVGFPVVQIKPFRDDMFIFGTTGIKKVRADASAAFLLDQVTANVGCIARDSVLEIGGDLIFMAPDGIRPVAGTSRIGDVELETISRPIQGRLLQLIKDNDLNLLDGVVVRSKSQFRYFLSGADTDSTDASGIIGGLTIGANGNIGWEFGETLGYRVSCCSSEYIGTQEYILHGDYDGNVYSQETGTSLNGNDLISIYSTPYLDFGDTEIKKVLHKVNVFIRSEGEFETYLSLDFDWSDPDTARPASYTANSPGSPTVWGGRGVEYNGTAVSFGGNSKPVLSVDLQGSGYSTRLNFVTVGTSKSHSIQGLVFEFALSGR